MTTLDHSNVRRLALGVLMPGFVGTELPDWLDALLRSGLGGVCLFAHNVDSLDQVAALTSAIYAANPMAIVSIDEEGGDVSRLHQRDGSPFPGNAVLGRIDDVTVTRSVGRAVGAELASVGIHLTLAPDADVNSDPNNPVIGVRSFGADPQLVAAHTTAWIQGVQRAGVAACAKHFPGHGDTSSDSHLTEPVVTADAQLLARREFVPFEAAIAAGVKTIMTSHIRVPALDPDVAATFSPAILGELLRGQMKFDGVIVTDALDMVGASGERGIPAAAVAAVAAGSDLLCLGSNNAEAELHAVADALTTAVTAGRLPVERLASAHRRSLWLARWMADQRLDDVRRVDSQPDPPLSVARVAASFTLSDHARHTLATGSQQLHWVEIEPQQNVAIGTTPFGPFYEGGAVPRLIVPVGARHVPDDFRAEPGVLTVIVGRELHRDEGARRAATDVASKAKASGGNAVVVDMGFVNSDEVDIATFGASRLVGQALIELLDGSI